MGFFSVVCLGCLHSIRSFDATDAHTRWMTRTVVITPTQPLIAGEYDGYGRVGTEDAVIGFEPVSAYHRACWMLLGQPHNAPRFSPYARDNGFFCETHPAQPMAVEDLEVLRADSGLGPDILAKPMSTALHDSEALKKAVDALLAKDS